jgi:hypothetical protein
MLIAAIIGAALLAGQASATTYAWSFDGFARDGNDIIGDTTISGFLELEAGGDGSFAATSVTVTSDPSGFLNSELTTLALGSNFAETASLNRFTVSGGEIVDALFTSNVLVSNPNSFGPDSGVSLFFNAAFNQGVGTPSFLSNVGRSSTAFRASLPNFSQVSAVPLPAGFWFLLSALAVFRLVAWRRTQRCGTPVLG